eukprot:15472781-Alexandrium_andersonii.AAC.1
MQAQVRTITAGGQPYRVRWRDARPPRAPRGPGEAAVQPAQWERLNVLSAGPQGTGGGAEGNLPPPAGGFAP